MHVTLVPVTIDDFEALVDMALPPEQAVNLASNRQRHSPAVLRLARFR